MVQHENKNGSSFKNGSQKWTNNQQVLKSSPEATNNIQFFFPPWCSALAAFCPIGYDGGIAVKPIENHTGVA
jgi:hypothetical protein